MRALFGISALFGHRNPTSWTKHERARLARSPLYLRWLPYPDPAGRCHKPTLTEPGLPATAVVTPICYLATATLVGPVERCATRYSFRRQRGGLAAAFLQGHPPYGRSFYGLISLS